MSDEQQWFGFAQEEPWYQMTGHHAGCDCCDCLMQDARDAEADHRLDMLREAKESLPDGL